MLCLFFLLQAEEAALGEMPDVVQAQHNFIAKHICPLGGHAVATNNFNNVQCLQKMASGFHLHVCALVICVSTSIDNDVTRQFLDSHALKCNIMRST